MNVIKKGFLLGLVLLLPGCCWNNCLQRCKTCTDCGLVHEPKKPLRQAPVQIDIQNEECCIEED